MSSKNKLFNFFINFKKLFLDLLFPIECLHCEKEGEWLCKKCFPKIKFNDKQICLGCKKEDTLGRICDNCKKNYSLDGVWVAGFFGDKLTQKLIKSLKYYFAQDVAKVLGQFMNFFVRDLLSKAKFLEKENLPNIFINFNDSLIIPVSLHAKRERWRGFNQSELLAQNVADYLNLEISSKLIRVKYKKAQAKIKAKKERAQNIKDCFKWTGNDLGGRNIIIIDDIVTTGSTLNEITRVLKQNNAGEVWGMVVARG